VKATLEHNQQRLYARISAAAASADRKAEGLTVVAITKYVDAPEALALASLGHTDLGENRHDKLESKAAAFRTAGVNVRWHFVGHLQRNKARRVAKVADVIHSVDTPRLIDTLDRAASEMSRRIQIFLELRLTEDPGKHGFAPDELHAGLDVLRSCRNLDALGLMCMSSTSTDSEGSAKTFAELSKYASELEADPSLSSLFLDGKVRTSMGMSGDFEEAISAGADYLRIGTSFFTGLLPSSKKETSS
jgi:PLP dependent protein